MAQLDPTETKLSSKPIWAEVMRAAVAVARQSILSERELLQAVSDELRRLKLNGAVMLLTPEGRLKVETTSSVIENALKKLTGWDILGYEFDPTEVEIYNKVLTSKEPLFTMDRQTIIRQ